MLDWKTDRERALDIATKTAIPFFIFAPTDFTQDLAQAMRSLYLNTISNTSKSAFDESLKNFEALIENAPDRVATYHYTDIIGYQSRYDNFSDKFRTILEKLAELEKEVKSLKKNNKNTKKIKLADEVTEKLAPQGTTVDSQGTDVSPLINETENQETHLASNAPNQETHLASNAKQTDNKIDLVYNYILQHPGIHTELDLANGLNLTKAQVCMAFNNLFKRPHIHGEKIKHIKVGQTHHRPNPNLRLYPQKTYQWVENLENNLSNDNKKIKWILPLYSHSG